MRKVTIKAESLHAAGERFKRTWKTGQADGEFITFETADLMLQTLTRKRWELINTLMRQGAMGLRELARMVKRDPKNVHTDITALKEIGLVQDVGEQIGVPYDEIDYIIMRPKRVAAHA
ncbi:MAG: winged helix-turn-helix transcriptional regulator [Gammaproteobacteria bacterium]